MGMAASQGRFLQLTSRKNAIGRQLNHLSLQEMALTRQMRQLSKDKTEALNSKVYKWTDNAGASYVDFTYANLTSPDKLTKNKNYLITDTSDRVVLNSRYLDYVERFSPDGKAGADWSGQTRLDILAEITGIDSSRIEEYEELGDTIYEKADMLAVAEANIPKPYKQRASLCELLRKDDKLLKMYNSGSEYDLADFTKRAKALKKYLPGDEDKWEQACEKVYTDTKTAIENILKNAKPEDVEACEQSGQFSAVSIMQLIIATYKSMGGAVVQGEGNEAELENVPLWWEPADYEAYISEYNTQKTLYDSAKTDYENAINQRAQLLTAEQLSSIRFYDAMFSAIAEKGWVYTPEIDDSAYLNEMLINNEYMITEVNRNTEFDEDEGFSISENEYSTVLASCFDHLVSISDDDARETMLAEYEYQKSIISEKETRIDTRKKDLQTELSAIQEMLQGLEAVRNKNIETNFSVMG